MLSFSLGATRMDTIKGECTITAGHLGGQAEVVWTWTEAGCWVQEVRRKSREEIYGFSERGHEVSWCERRAQEERFQTEACDWLEAAA